MTTRNLAAALRFAAPVLLMAAVATGCLSGEAPLPPNEALAKASQRIDALLQEERRFENEPAAVVNESPKDAHEVTVWYASHPLVSPVLLGKPERLRAFQDAHPGLRVATQYIGDWNVAIQKLTVSLAAGDVPDIALVKRGLLARLIGSALIAPLDTLLPAALVDDLRPQARQSCTARGHLWAIPADGFCSMLFVNRAKVPGTLPATWDAWLTCARAVSMDTQTGACAIGAVPFVPMLWSAGGEVCNETSSSLDSPQAREALEFILSLCNEDLANPATLGDPSSGFGLFLRERVAMTVASSEFIPQLKSISFPAAIAPIPGKTGPISMLSDTCWVVFARYAQAKKEAIAQTLDFLTGESFQGAGSFPIRKSVQPVQSAYDPGPAFNCARNTPLVGPWAAIEFELEHYLSLACRWRSPMP